MRRGLWLIPLIALSFLVQLPLPAEAACPGSCTNNQIAFTVARTSAGSNTVSITPNAGNFLVFTAVCTSGITVSTLTDNRGNTWTKYGTASISVTGTGNIGPMTYSIWSVASSASGLADTLTVTLSGTATNGCSEEVAAWDTLANIYAETVSAAAVYVCTGTSSLGNPCGSNPQTYTNSVSDAGTSLLAVSTAIWNSSVTGIYASLLGTTYPGVAASGGTQNNNNGCTPFAAMWGGTCQHSNVYKWQGSGFSSYAIGWTLNLGVVGDPASGANCARGNGGKCYSEAAVVTSVFSNIAQSATVIGPCNFFQLQCWWYPLLFMGLYSGFILMVASRLNTSPRGKAHLFLSALTYGSLVAVIFGIMNIVFPLLMLILNTIIALRLRG